MTHIEGPIVDSFYDMSLCSWSKKLEPPLPTCDLPAASIWRLSSEQPNDNVHHKASPRDAMAPLEKNADLPSTSVQQKALLPEHSSKDPHYDSDIEAEFIRAQSVLEPRGSETRINAITRHLSKRTCYFPAYMFT